MDDTTIVNVGTEKINALWATVSQYAFAFGIKILAAIAFWVIGRWLIGFAVGMVQKSLERQKVDPTVLRYVGSFITVTLNVLLVVGILGFFGIQTTSLAALIAAVGLAIGMAWSGLLANLAAGGFIIVLRPFKVGDFICAGGVTGTVKEIGLFTTAINTPDNVLTMVGNNKIFGDNIQNFTHNPFRRVELKAQLSGAADYQAAIALLKQRVAAIPNVLGEPPVDVEILEFNLVGPVLAVRPYCHNDHYWQVYFDTNKVIKDALGTDAGADGDRAAVRRRLTFPARHRRPVLRGVGVCARTGWRAARRKRAIGESNGHPGEQGIVRACNRRRSRPGFIGKRIPCVLQIALDRRPAGGIRVQLQGSRPGGVGAEGRARRVSRQARRHPLFDRHPARLELQGPGARQRHPPALRGQGRPGGALRRAQVDLRRQ